MGNDFARSINAPYLFGGDELDECSLGKYYYKTIGNAGSPINVVCTKCSCPCEKNKLYSIILFKDTINESVILFQFAPDDITTSYTQSAGISADKDGPKVSADISKTVTIKKGSPLVKMILAKTNKKITDCKSINDLYNTYCVDCMLKEDSQKSRIKSILLHVHGNGYVVNSNYKIVSPTYGDSK
mgnify:CR=1 FL=1